MMENCYIIIMSYKISTICHTMCYQHLCAFVLGLITSTPCWQAAPSTLQKVQSSAARLVLRTRKRVHATPLLFSTLARIQYSLSSSFCPLVTVHFIELSIVVL